jgi:hypothetical protein
VTEARFGVLTNGIVYRFYTDLDAPNKMDAKPFFEFDLTDYREHDLEELKKFSKSSYDLQDILNTASELKYTKEIQKILAQQLQSPSEEFVRFFTAQVYQGRMTQAVRDQFTQTALRAFRQFISEQVNERLKSALGAEVSRISVDPAQPETPQVNVAPAPESPIVVTTAEELEAFFTIKAILHPLVPSRRVSLRDVQSYCGILLDDNNRKPICRLYLNGARKQLGFFDNEERKENRVQILAVEEIHNYADRLKATVEMYGVGK